MSYNLSKRILTSIILLCILFFGIFVNKYFWLFLLISASVISYYEFFNLIKIKYKKEKYKFYLYNIISFSYLSFFVFTGYGLYYSSSSSLIFIILICIFSDTGGYIVGKSIGGKKLSNLSPNKTISGSIGSFIFSLFPIFIFEFFLNYFYNSQNILILLLYCLFLSLICQVGDLFISYFKRQADVKDTGTLLPGHGGLLDRIDGIIFVLPVAYILDKIIFY
tara:strand:+ start:2809 stop:3471 length:663 start_codon:yes stop_codon:yes gene_type:complete